MNAPTNTLTLNWTNPTTGDRVTQVVTLPATIGRGAHASVRLNSTQVSRDHARIGREEGQLVLTDTSRNGTLVNGERRQRWQLLPGDIIQVGPFRIEVRLGGRVNPDAPTIPAGGDDEADTALPRKSRHEERRDRTW